MAAPTFNTYYTHWSDEVARLADITIESDTSPSRSGGDDYAPASLVDDNPAKVAKINETDGGSPATGLVSGAWRLAYAQKQIIAFAALIHGTFDETVDSPGSPAPSVRLEANDSGVFGSPSFVAEFTIPPWLGAGTGRWPQNAFLDLTLVDGYNPLGWLFYWLVVENNSQNIELGELRLHPVIRQFDPDLRWGLRVGADKPMLQNRTAFGVKTKYGRGTTLWRQDADILLTDAMRDALEAHYHDVEGGLRPFVIAPSGPGRSDRCYLCEYAETEYSQTWSTPDFYTQRLAFQEVGRGLRPGE